MKILFIGGTKFVGRQMVEDALKLGYQIEILQRGKTNADIFPQIKKHFGDRNQIASLLPASEKWDVVIDTCGYHPESVKISTEFLKDKTSLYIYISTCSVYSDFSIPGVNELSPVYSMKPWPSLNTPITGENYGALKAECDEVVLKTLPPEKALILRPTLIVGTYDETNRFGFWIKSILLEKELEVPNDPKAFVQFIDVRALSQFALNAHSKKLTGIYNMIGPQKPLRFLDFIDKAKNILNPKLQVKLSTDKTKNYPMYVDEPGWEGFFHISGEKAYHAGLKEILPEDTIQKTADYLKLGL